MALILSSRSLAAGHLGPRTGTHSWWPIVPGDAASQKETRGACSATSSSKLRQQAQQERGLSPAGLATLGPRTVHGRAPVCGQRPRLSCSAVWLRFHENKQQDPGPELCLLPGSKPLLHFRQGRQDINR